MSVKLLELTRIDDRLVHGQVCLSWVKEYPVANILVCDDITSRDPFIGDLFKELVPEGIEVEVLNTDETAKKLEKGLEEATMLLVKSPKTLKTLVDKGIDIKEINFGGMGLTDYRKKFYKSIFCSDDDIAIFKEFVDKGINVWVQTLPTDRKVNVATLLK